MKSVRQIVLIWIVWVVVMIGYMQFISMRYKPERPDNALVWSAGETTSRAITGKIYLLDPFFGTQTGWDSEFYLAIATTDYDDGNLRRATGENGEAYSLAYAFFPLYPYLMKVVRLPFVLLGLNPIAASVAAGLIISLLGTLGGMLAIYDIARDELGEEGAVRTAFLLLIFPTSFFFATVYTEGLFIALAFGSLAFLRRKYWLYAAILAAFATWTRAVGAVLLAPLLLSWALELYESQDKKRHFWRLPLMFSPLFAYLLWRFAFGKQFDFVELNWFGNGILELNRTFEAWQGILLRAQEFPETKVIIILGISSIVLALGSCLLNIRKYPMLAIFGFFALLIPLLGGWTGTQSSIRYVLVVPTLWLSLGQWSRNPVFERGWTLLSILLLAMQAVLFSADMWVA